MRTRPVVDWSGKNLKKNARKICRTISATGGLKIALMAGNGLELEHGEKFKNIILTSARLGVSDVEIIGLGRA